MQIIAVKTSWNKKYFSQQVNHLHMAASIHVCVTVKMSLNFNQVHCLLTKKGSALSEVSSGIFVNLSRKVFYKSPTANLIKNSCDSLTFFNCKEDLKKSKSKIFHKGILWIKIIVINKCGFDQIVNR